MAAGENDAAQAKLSPEDVSKVGAVVDTNQTAEKGEHDHRKTELEATSWRGGHVAWRQTRRLFTRRAGARLTGYPEHGSVRSAQCPSARSFLHTALAHAMNCSAGRGRWRGMLVGKCVL